MGLRNDDTADIINGEANYVVWHVSVKLGDSFDGDDRDRSRRIQKIEYLYQNACATFADRRQEIISKNLYVYFETKGNGCNGFIIPVKTPGRTKTESQESQEINR